MKAVLEVRFDPETMIDSSSLKTEWNNDLLKLMKWLFKEENIGIFEEEIKLIGVKP